MAITHRPVQHSFRRYVLAQVEGLRVLDVGCAAGNYLELFDGRSVGFDISTADLEACECKGLPVTLCEFNQGLACQSGKLDAVFCSHVMEHVNSPINLLKDCRRVLCDGGLLILGLPFEKTLAGLLGKVKYFEHHEGHLYAFSLENVRVLLQKAGFSPPDIYIEPWPARRLQNLGLLNPALSLIQRLPEKMGLYLSCGFWLISRKSA